MGGGIICPPPVGVILRPPSSARVNPRRHRGGGWCNPPRFFWNIFFIYRSNVTIFDIAFPPSFLRPPWKFQDPDPLTFDLWHHNWGVMSGGKCVPWHITCKHRCFCYWCECGHVVPSSTHAFHRSSGPTQVPRSTEVKWGQWPLPTFLSSSSF